MRNSSMPVRLSSDLTESARSVAGAMSRSVTEQITHWARIGRELERSATVSVAAIADVLDGAGEYDALPAKEQAIVRAAWLGRMETLRGDLRLDRELARRASSRAELDDRGEVVIKAQHGARWPLNARPDRRARPASPGQAQARALNHR